MARYSCRILLVTAFCALLPLVASAQWSSDPANNLPIADGPTKQGVPKLAATSDGGCYVCWYDCPETDVFNVRLQRLGPLGVEMFPHNGLLVSDHPSNTWTMDWDLIVDAEDNAVLAFNDLRHGEWDVQIYKIGPQGDFLWGPDGISLTESLAETGSPSLALSRNGDVVVVWPEGRTRNEIMMQRLGPDGTLKLAEGGAAVAGEPGDYAYFPQVIPADGDNVIVAWVPNYDYTEPRHLAARKFDAAGLPVWPDDIPVLELDTIPMGHKFNLIGDGAGGAFLAWTFAGPDGFVIQAQHLTSGGVESWAHNGHSVFLDPDFEYLLPSIDVDADTGELYIFGRTEVYVPELFQTKYGTVGQKLAPDGQRLWGDAGRVLLPVTETWISMSRALFVPGGGAMVFVLVSDESSSNARQLVSLRADSDGNPVWPGNTVVMAAAWGPKLNVHAVMGNDGAAKVIWEDEGSGNSNILGQNIFPDGGLGQSVVPVSRAVFCVEPGPDGTRISWSIDDRTVGGVFRLTGAFEDREWEVPFREVIPGRYEAMGPNPVSATGGVLVYSLFLRTGDDTWSMVDRKSVEIPAAQLALKGAYPNPCNPRTTVVFSLDRTRRIQVDICDLRGRRIAGLIDGVVTAGPHEIVWPGTDDAGREVSSGTYLVRLSGEDLRRTAKIMLLR